MIIDAIYSKKYRVVKYCNKKAEKGNEPKKANITSDWNSIRWQSVIFICLFSTYFSREIDVCFNVIILSLCCHCDLYVRIELLVKRISDFKETMLVKDILIKLSLEQFIFLR
jgi:hypothetical protein